MQTFSRFGCALVAATCWTSSRLAAQTPTTPLRVPVRGVAYDELRREPLRDARVTLVGASRTTTTDSRGRFQFDSVPAGDQTFTTQHASLDSVGLSGLRTRATITNGRDEVRISLPSFSALWRAVCAGPAPADSGLIYGTVRDASTMQPVANAKVEMSWIELLYDRQRKVFQRQWKTEAVTDSSGSYSLCGVAPDLWLRLQASRDSTASGAIDISPSAFRVRRRDLLIGASASDSTRRGTVAGIVTNEAGYGVSNARVVVAGMPEVQTDTAGRFVVTKVPAGTRQVDVSFIGARPVSTVIDITANDTAFVATRLATHLLKPVTIVEKPRGRVLAAAFDARRRSGAGYSLDSTTISRYNAFTNVLQNIPSTRTEIRRSNLIITMPNGRGGQCVPQVFIDGIEGGLNHLVDLQPREVAGLEVFPHALSAPTQFVRAGGLVPPCGMILVWTKYGFSQR